MQCGPEGQGFSTAGAATGVDDRPCFRRAADLIEVGVMKHLCLQTAVAATMMRREGQSTVSRTASLIFSPACLTFAET